MLRWPNPPHKMLNKPLPLHIFVITLFPDIFANHLKHLPISRALEKGLLQIDFINLRDFAIDKRGTVDSPPYGGGPGMILRPEPIFDAINFALNRNDNDEGTQIIFLTPRGKTYHQAVAQQLATLKNLIIVCGRYEGIDQRVVNYFHAQEISIGNYVLSGGEVASMAIIESVTRLIPGAIENQEALISESFNPSEPTQTEHPQYSRPEEWQGLKVPQTLLSGHHKKVDDWKTQNFGKL